MGRFTVNTEPLERLFKNCEALRLRLAPTKFTEKQAKELLVLIENNLADHVESGTLRSAFSHITLYKSDAKIAAVGLGDRRILPRTDVSPRGTIKDFVEWLKGERKKRWAGFKSQWAGTQQKKSKWRSQIREIREKRRTKRAILAKPKKWTRTTEVKFTHFERTRYAAEFVSAVRQARKFHQLHPTFKKGRLKIIRETWKSMVPQISKKQRSQVFRIAKEHLRKHARTK